MTRKVTVVTGHEQAGDRPAIIVSPGAYNQKTGLALMCPIRSKRKGYPFEVELPYDLEISGVILSDQIKSLDWQARNVRFACKASNEVITEALAKIKVLLE
ncbi:MAG: type II toxin-antitoxin system PemK/MazF family toxin [Syntrophomonadales bacterium]|jgi:mRNA interferase MazF